MPAERSPPQATGPPQATERRLVSCGAGIPAQCETRAAFLLVLSATGDLSAGGDRTPPSETRARNSCAVRDVGGVPTGLERASEDDVPRPNEPLNLTTVCARRGRGC